MNLFSLNREIAYRGEAGRRRADFLTEYIRRKREVFERMRQDIDGQMQTLGERITCRAGCPFCCRVYVHASIQECEVIVYYLYRNENVLSLFLSQYQKWKEKLQEYGELIERCERGTTETGDAEYAHETQRALRRFSFFYKMLDIPCPFLHSGSCAIYEVRPFTCAAHYVTTPPEWCHPQSPTPPKVYKAAPGKVMFDVSFYYRSLVETTFLFPPPAVYGILNHGYAYLSGIRGLENIEKDVMNDPEVKAIVRGYGGLSIASRRNKLPAKPQRPPPAQVDPFPVLFQPA